MRLYWQVKFWIVKRIIFATFLLFFMNSYAQDNSYLNHNKQENWIDTCNLLVDTSKNLITQDGFFMCYYYAKGMKNYNYNLLFIPSFEISDTLIHKLLSLSKSYYAAPLGYRLSNSYVLSGNFIKDFESVFNVSWVVAHHSSSDKFRYLKEKYRYNSEITSVLFSDIKHFQFDNIRTDDSMQIIFKCIPIKATLELQAYSKCLQKSKFKSYFKILHYYDQDKGISVILNKSRIWSKLDERIISPIFATILLIEYKDDFLIEHGKELYKRRINDTINFGKKDKLGN